MNQNPKIVVLRRKRLIIGGMIALCLLLLALMLYFTSTHVEKEERTTSVSQTLSSSEGANSDESETADINVTENTTSGIASKTEDDAHKTAYVPGIYSSSLMLDNSLIEIEMAVDNGGIKSARIKNMDEDVKSMYPLMEDAMKDIASQLQSGTPMNEISYPDDSKYTYLILLDGVNQALSKAVK